MKSITVPAEIEQMETVQDFIGVELEENGCSMKAQMQINIAIDEIVSNIVHYAYTDIGQGLIEIRCEVKGGVAEISTLDSGKQYNPLEAEDPDVTLSAEERKIGGLGLFMVKKIMDEVLYEYSGGRNILTIRKKI